MENEEDETSEGLNQIIEIINAKGDTGELKEIVKRNHKGNQAEKEEPRRNI